MKGWKFVDNEMLSTLAGWRTTIKNFYSGIWALEICWAKRISVGGNYMEKWQNSECTLCCNCIKLRTFWMPLI